MRAACHIHYFYDVWDMSCGLRVPLLVLAKRIYCALLVPTFTFIGPSCVHNIGRQPSLPLPVGTYFAHAGTIADTLMPA